MFTHGAPASAGAGWVSTQGRSSGLPDRTTDVVLLAAVLVFAVFTVVVAAVFTPARIATGERRKTEREKLDDEPEA